MAISVCIVQSCSDRVKEGSTCRSKICCYLQFKEKAKHQRWELVLRNGTCLRSWKRGTWATEFRKCLNAKTLSVGYAKPFFGYLSSKGLTKSVITCDGFTRCFMSLNRWLVRKDSRETVSDYFLESVRVEGQDLPLLVKKAFHVTSKVGMYILKFLFWTTLQRIWTGLGAWEILNSTSCKRFNVHINRWYWSTLLRPVSALEEPGKAVDCSKSSGQGNIFRQGT